MGFNSGFKGIKTKRVCFILDAVRTV